MGKKVKMQKGCLLIDNKPVILLASSLFYFRIPPEYWRTRMRQLKVAGYNAIDVYFPWNFHELTPDEWCFDGMHDADLFLEMALQEELYVIARPGPYICSEWDGGGFPAWLDDVKCRLRQYDEVYLKELSRWMDRILPIIAKRQFGNAGSVVLLQLENELDSFPCINPTRYLEALAELARAHGLEIPYVACTSQFDIEGAGGIAAGLCPSYNIYPNPDDAMAEQKMQELYHVMQVHGTTFLTTETDREHRFMRRELASGLRLISPYCQTATSDYDCFNGVSSWGGNFTNPLSYMTNDYDHGAMIKADGVITEEFLQARLMANLMNSLGEKLAAGRPFAAHDIGVDAAFQTNRGGFYAMALDGGGMLLCLPNLGNEAGKARLSYHASEFALTVPPKTTALLLFELPLDRWGLEDASIVWSALEIGWIAREGNDVVLSVYGEGDGLCLALPQGEVLVSGDADFELPGGRLHVIKRSREQAAREQTPYLPPLTEKMLGKWKSLSVSKVEKEVFNYPQPTGNTTIDVLEKKGIYRGSGIYQFTIPQCRGVLLEGTSDILALEHNGQHYSTWFGTGARKRLPITGGQIKLRAEIWGHTCNDSGWHPNMRLGSKRGLSGALALLEEIDIRSNWHYLPDSDRWGDTFRTVLSEYPTIVDIGFRAPRSRREPGAYRKQVVMPEQGDTRLLSFAGCKVPACVYIDGRRVAEVDPGDPYVDITGYTKAGRPAELVVRVITSLKREPVGDVALISAKRIYACEFAAWQVSQLQRLSWNGGEACQLPLSLAAGEVCKLMVRPPLEKEEFWLRLKGTEVKATLIQDGHVLGRLFVGCRMYPLVVSGDPDRIWLPGAWLAKSPECILLAEGMKNGALLEEICFDWR